MPFSIVAADIAKVRADALVVAADSGLVADGGVGLAIARAAGLRRMRSACRAAAPCAVGDAVATSGFDLAADHVIHAVAPVWRGGDQGEEALLRSAYRNALSKAFAVGAKSVALPLLGTGQRGVPVGVSLDAARAEVRAFLDGNDDFDITLVVFSKEAIRASAVEWEGAQAHLERLWEQEQQEKRGRRPAVALGFDLASGCLSDSVCASEESAAVGGSFAAWEEDGLSSVQNPCCNVAASAPRAAKPAGLEDLLANLDAGFSDTLLALIDARGLTDAQVYKRANMSRQLFSKIRSNVDYVPTKRTVLSLAVALELTLDETEDLLARAGFALSRSSRFDVIMEYLISRGVYDVFTINETLFQFDQPLLGGRG